MGRIFIEFVLIFPAVSLLVSADSRSTPTKRKPETDMQKTPGKRQERSDTDDMMLMEEDEPTEEELAEIEDSAADLDAQQDGEEKEAILQIVQDDKFHKNHPIEVLTITKGIMYFIWKLYTFFFFLG